MSINKIDAPLSTSPATFATPVVNQLLALSIDYNHHAKISGSYVLKGALFNIGGSMFIADSDTLISGTRSDSTVAIMFTVSGSVATASYSDTINSATWNGAYQGYYDVSGNMYYRECGAGNATLIKEIQTISVDNMSAKTFTTQIYMVGKTGLYKSTVRLVCTSVNKTTNGNIKIKYNNLGFEKSFNFSIPEAATSVFNFDTYLEKGDTVYIIVTINALSSGSANIPVTCALQNDYEGVYDVIS